MGLSSRRLPFLLRVPASPVPRSQQYYEGATTSHPRIYGRLLVRSRSPHDPPAFVLAAALPQGRRSPPGPDIGSAGCPSFRQSHAWTRMGSLRSSGDPSRAFALFHDPGRTGVPSPLTVTSVLPPLPIRRRLRRWLISGLTHSFGTCCPTLHAWRCRTRARLASGWLAGLGREGVEPSGSLRKVSVRFDDHPPFLLS